MAGALRRDLGLAAATSVVGSMIGVGIFLGPRVIAQTLPTPGLVLLVWLLGGLFVFCGALTYAELGAAFPESGGIYAYMRDAYGRLPAFLTGWSGFAVGKAASVSALAVGFTEFADEAIRLVDPTLALAPGAVIPMALTLIALVSLVNIVGVRHAGRLAVVTTTIKVGAIVVLVLAGLAVLVGRVPGLLEAPITPPGIGAMDLLSAFGVALIPVFFAYDGWVNSTQVAEEVKDPAKNVPRSLILGTLAVVAAYTLVNLVYLLALGSDRIGEPGAASNTARILGGDIGAFLIVGAILISIIGTVNAVSLSGPRIAFAMSRDGLFFRGIDKVNKWGTPGWAIALQGAIAAALVLVPPIGGRPLFDTLLTYIIVDSFIFYGAGAAAVFILRRKRPDAPRPYRVPLYPLVPLVFVLGSAAFLVNAFITTPLDSLAGVAIVLLALPGYFYWTWRNQARRARTLTYRVLDGETPRP